MIRDRGEAEGAEASVLKGMFNAYLQLSFNRSSILFT